MQNAFLDDKGSLARMGIPVERARRPIPEMRRVLGAARAAKLPVIHVRMLLRADMADIGIIGKVFPPLRELGHCAAGSWDAGFYAGCEPAPGEVVVDKNRFSGFFGTPLESQLRCLGVDTLIVIGIATNVCVESTVRDAFFRDFRVVVPREATASFTEAMEAGSLGNFEFAFARVAPVADVVAALSPGT
jgi:ureidoacrylate peracid hydrolase